jgi:hypothetical protein
MAAVFSNGRDFTVGLNQFKTHPLQARFCTHPDRLYLHAEIHGLARAFQKGITIDRVAIARVLKNGQPALARPCLGCMAALDAFDIKRIEWTE